MGKFHRAYYWGYLILFSCGLAYADSIPPPPPLTKQPVEEQQYLKTISDNFNNLTVVTDAPNGNRKGKKGDIVMYDTGAGFQLWVNTTGTSSLPTTVWQQI